MLQGWKLAAAVGLGTAVVYVLDHARGREVKGGRWLNAARRLMRLDQVTARRLAARVRATMASAVTEPRAIDLQVEDGAVILRGPVPARELDSLLDAVWRTRGVDHVDVRLELLETGEEMPASAPSADAGPARQGWRPGFRMVALVGFAGAGLTLRALASGRTRLAARRAT